MKRKKIFGFSICKSFNRFQSLPKTVALFMCESGCALRFAQMEIVDLGSVNPKKTETKNPF